MRVFGSLALSSALSACSGGPPPEPAASPDEARAEVAAVFEAIHAQDCDVLGAHMPRVSSREACDDYLEDARSHGLSLVRIVDATNDGRRPRAVIVRCRVQMEGEERDLLVRAERTEAGWSVEM